MQIGTLVKHKETSKVGFVTTDNYGYCEPSEVPVVWEGETFLSGTDHDELETLPDQKIEPDMEKCGAGQGSKCCMFLGCAADGFICLRQTALRDGLVWRVSDMNARRHPVSMYPQCMDVEDGEIEESREEQEQRYNKSSETFFEKESND